jgi:hypothetical protein
VPRLMTADLTPGPPRRPAPHADRDVYLADPLEVHHHYPAWLPKPPTPAQLPADVTAFTGRTSQLKLLDRLLLDAREATETTAAHSGPPADPQHDLGSNAVVISAVSGAGGVGKIALAVRWAHRHRYHL